MSEKCGIYTTFPTEEGNAEMLDFIMGMINISTEIQHLTKEQIKQYNESKDTNPKKPKAHPAKTDESKGDKGAGSSGKSGKNDEKSSGQPLTREQMQYQDRAIAAYVASKNLTSAKGITVADLQKTKQGLAGWHSVWEVQNATKESEKAKANAAKGDKGAPKGGKGGKGKGKGKGGKGNPNQPSSSSKPLCWYIQNKQTCPFGDRCRFAHDAGGGKAHTGVEKKNDPRSKMPCDAWVLRGECKRKDCPYDHPESEKGKFKQAG